MDRPVTTDDKPAPPFCSNPEHPRGRHEIGVSCTQFERRGTPGDFSVPPALLSNLLGSGDHLVAMTGDPPAVSTHIPAGTVTGSVRVEMGRPAPEHPAPWLWEAVSDFMDRETGRPCYTAIGLADARGTPIVSVNSADTIDIASSYVRELIRVAPELEALLRAEDVGQSCEYGDTPAFCSMTPVCWRHRRDATLARIGAK